MSGVKKKLVSAIKEMRKDNLKFMTDRELLLSAEAAASKERAALIEVLRHLVAIEDRKIYALNYSSLFAYVTQALKYSESAAQRRISSARFLREFPHIEPMIASGALSLSNLSQAASFFHLEKKRGQSLPTEKKVEILQGLEGKSARDGMIYLLSHSSEPEKLKRKPKAGLRPVGSGYVQLTALFDEKQSKKFKHVKDLMAHTVPDGDEAQVIERLMDSYIDRHDPLEKAKRARARKKRKGNAENGGAKKASVGRARGSEAASSGAATSGSGLRGGVTSDTDRSTAAASVSTTADTDNSARTGNTADTAIAYDIDPVTGEIQIRFTLGDEPEHRRYIAADVRHAVILRDQSTDQGGCTWVDEHGCRCGRQHGLEFDHLIPFALGGTNTIDNLTLRCRAHNSFRAVQEFGHEAISKVIQISRRLQTVGPMIE